MNNTEQIMNPIYFDVYIPMDFTILAYSSSRFARIKSLIRSIYSWLHYVRWLYLGKALHTMMLKRVKIDLFKRSKILIIQCLLKFEDNFLSNESCFRMTRFDLQSEILSRLFASISKVLAIFLLFLTLFSLQYESVCLWEAVSR